MKKRNLNVGYLTREGFRNVYTNRLMSAASISVLFSCLVMVGIAVLLMANINMLIDSIEAQNVIMVFLEDDATAEQAQQVGTRLRALENVASADFISKQEALDGLMDELGSIPDLLINLDENPLPDAYSVTVRDMNLFGQTDTQIEALDFVFSTRENHEIAAQLANTRRAMSSVSIGVIVLLLLVSLFIIANTIRITMSARELEISIMKGVGATNAFIRWPFMIEGILLGLFAAVLSTGAVWGLYTAVLRSMKFLSNTVLGQTSLLPFSRFALPLLLGFVLVGVLTGIFGSTISLRRYLKEKEAAGNAI